MNLPYSDFDAGPEGQKPLAAGGEALAPTICYEDAYGVGADRHSCRKSTLLVNVTNDAWFGDSSAPHQHLDISRMRSLETGRPMLRATNDGVTALIAHDGTAARRAAAVPAGRADGLGHAADRVHALPAPRQLAGPRAGLPRPRSGIRRLAACAAEMQDDRPARHDHAHGREIPVRRDAKSSTCRSSRRRPATPARLRTASCGRGSRCRWNSRTSTSG